MKKTPPLFLITCALAIAMLLLGSNTSLDAKLYYTGDQARALLAGLDSAGVERYFINELLDLLLILSYSTLLFVGFKKVFPGRRIVCCLAFVPGFFDLIETLSLLYILGFGGATSHLDWLGTVTFLKWATGAVALVVLAFSLRVRKS